MLRKLDKIIYSSHIDIFSSSVLIFVDRFNISLSNIDFSNASFININFLYINHQFNKINISSINYLFNQFINENIDNDYRFLIADEDNMRFICLRDNFKIFYMRDYAG